MTPKRHVDIQIRQAAAEDIPALVRLNEAAYPTLAEDNIVWGQSHLRSHQRLFPQGQLVAEVDGRVVGACASLIVDLGRDPLRSHTWAGITDSGYFTNHDPLADTLYGADVYVHPEMRGLGIGHALYGGRRQLCKKLNLRRMLAGGRLIAYYKHAEHMSPEEYAAKVARGELYDAVLSFQLKEGFALKGIMPHYLRDPQSLNFATLIEWLNPDYKPRHGGGRKVRISCVQYQMRKVHSFSDLAGQVAYYTDIAADYQSDFVLFPELFSVQLLSCFNALSAKEGIAQLADHDSQLQELFRQLATRYGLTIIGGSHPTHVKDRIENVCYVCLPDGSIYHQPKLHITPNERKWWGISGGHHLGPIDTPTGKIGVLICYDIEFPETARILADEGAEIIFVPFCTDNRQGYLRVRYCAQTRAIENQVYVAMAGNVGNLPDVHNLDINYGQACVLTPSDFEFARDGIAAESDSSEETILVSDLDLDDLYAARARGTVTPRLDRRHDLFQLVRYPLVRQNPQEHVEGPLGDQPRDDQWLQNGGPDAAP
jgi:predicted amidohydrolase/GNAT superfamily N-acetyltransferase